MLQGVLRWVFVGIFFFFCFPPLLASVATHETLQFIQEIVRLHGVLVSIVSDRDPRFMDHFWESFQRAMGT